MIFSNDGVGCTLEPARRLDIAMAAANIEKHPDKDEDDKFNCTCVGVDLVQGRWWRPHVARLWVVLYAAAHVWVGLDLLLLLLSYGY